MVEDGIMKINIQSSLKKIVTEDLEYSEMGFAFVETI